MPHEVDGDLALDSQIMRGHPLTDAAVILAERDIQDPAAKWFGIGLAPRSAGHNVCAPVPHGHWKITTLVAGLRTTGITEFGEGLFDGRRSGP